MQGVDQRLLNFASKDPDLARNMNDFAYFATAIGAMTVVATTATKKEFQVGDRGDVRSVKVVSPRSINQKKEITNDPHGGYRRGDDRIYNLDSIPYSIYKKMEKDPSIMLALDLIIGVVSSLRYEIKVDGNPKAEAVLNHIYKSHHSHVVNNIISTSYPYGFAFAEKVLMTEKVELDWVVDGEKKRVFSGNVISFKKVKFIDPEANIYFYKSPKDDEISRIEQYQKGKPYVVKRRKLLWFALDRKFSNVFGRSRFKVCYPQWYYDNVNYQLSLAHVDRNGSPHIEARYPEGEVFDARTGDKRQADDIMAEALEGLVSNGVILLPSTRDEKSGNYLWEIRYVEPKNSNTTVYSDFSDINTKKKYQAFRVPDAVLMSDGNFSETDAKLDIMTLTLDGLIDQIESAIFYDLILYIAAVNFGPSIVSKVSFKITRGGLKRSPMLKELLRDQNRLLSSLGGYKPKYALDVREMANELGVGVVPVEELVEEDENANQEGMTPEEEKIRDEDSNGKDRATPDERKRERPTKSNVGQR